MGIAPSQLIERYPVLYHMAFPNSWPSMQQLGLLSSSALVELFEVPEPRRTTLLTSQRRGTETFLHAIHGSASLRDQKPLSEKNLTRCLIDCSPSDWYRILNERVFFWLNRDRLLTLMSAAEYAGEPHTVLELDTAGLLSQYLDRIELAHMNTGNTRPFAHPRGASTFRTLKSYPYGVGDASATTTQSSNLLCFRECPTSRTMFLKVDFATVDRGQYKTIEEIYRRPSE